MHMVSAPCRVLRVVPPLVWLLAMSFWALYCGFLPAQVFVTAEFHQAGRLAMVALGLGMACSTLVSSAVTVMVGARPTLVFSSALTLVFVATLALELEPIVQASAGLAGLGSALLWTASAEVISELSTPGTRGRNNGVLFACFRASALANLSIGQAVSHGVAKSTMFTIVLVVAVVGWAGLLLLWLLGWRATGHIKAVPKGHDPAAVSPSLVQHLKGLLSSIFVVFFDKRMAALAPICYFSIGMGKGFVFTEVNVAIQYALSDGAVGIIIATGGIVAVVASLGMGTLYDMLPPRHRPWLFVVGVAASGCGFALPPFTGPDVPASTGMLYVTCCCIGISFGLEACVFAVMNCTFFGEQRVAAFALKVLLDALGTSSLSGGAYLFQRETVSILCVSFCALTLTCIGVFRRTLMGPEDGTMSATSASNSTPMHKQEEGHTAADFELTTEAEHA